MKLFVKWDKTQFPSLCDLNHHVALPAMRRYNCIAWAAGDDQNFWWPVNGGYWPEGAPKEYTMAAFIAAFATRRYTPCKGAAFEPGLEKVAIYEGYEPINAVVGPLHAARQLRDVGCWASKMGRNVGIEHFGLDAVAGKGYGEPAVFLSRPIQP